MASRTSIALAAAVHALILALPLAVSGRLLGAAGDVATCVFFLLATAFCAVELRAQRGDGSLADDATSVHLARATGLVLLIVFWSSLVLRGAQGFGAPGAWTPIGVTAMAGGVLLRYAAIRRLGPYFVSDLRVWPEQPLITDGVYARIRHPSESGTLLVALGAVALLESRTGLLVALGVLMPLVVVRVRREDRMLSRAFAEHARYAARVPALVPSLSSR